MRRLGKSLPRLRRCHRPGLELTLLGIGLNGHLGLDEPGSSSTPRPDASNCTRPPSPRRKYLTHKNLPTWAWALLETLAGLERSLVVGERSAKAEIIQRIVKGPIAADVPASLDAEPSELLVVLDPESQR